MIPRRISALCSNPSKGFGATRCCSRSSTDKAGADPHCAWHDWNRLRVCRLGYIRARLTRAVPFMPIARADA